MTRFDLTVLGCGDAFGSGGWFQTSFLIDLGQMRLLLDCGATTLVALKRASIEPATIDLTREQAPYEPRQDEDGEDLDAWSSFAGTSPRWRDASDRHPSEDPVDGLEWSDEEPETRREHTGRMCRCKRFVTSVRDGRDGACAAPPEGRVGAPCRP